MSARCQVLCVACIHSKALTSALGQSKIRNASSCEQFKGRNKSGQPDESMDVNVFIGRIRLVIYDQNQMLKIHSLYL